MVKEKVVPVTKQVKVPGLQNLCPFGCEDDQLDEWGYCRHLVGFTNDNKIMELRQRGSPKERVKKSDIIVPREPSSRVYRDVPAEVTEELPEPTE